MEAFDDLVFELAVPPTPLNENLCFKACRSGLYRSTDGGASWHMVSGFEHEESLLASTVAFSPNFVADRTVFAGTYGAVAKSIDAGDSWVITALSSPPSLVSALVISPNYDRDGTLFAATLEDGIFRSTDRGSTWNTCNFGLIDFGVLSMTLSPAFKFDGIALAGTETGLFKSTNSGRSWREIGVAENLSSILCIAASPNFTERSDVFAGTADTGLWRSNDAGKTWNTVGDEQFGGAVNSILLAPSFPEPPDLLITTDIDVFLSRDDGASWWKPTTNLDTSQGIASAVAPCGLGVGAPLLVALQTGGVKTVRVES